MIKHGFDISHYQHVLDWPLIAGSQDFAIFKAGEGRHEDAGFSGCVAQARLCAMTWGAYWFYRSDVPVVDQIDAYFAVLDRELYGQACLYPALDVEPETGLAFGPGQAANVTAFLRAIVERYGKALCYCSQHDWHTLGNPPVISDPDVLLWVANYTTAPAPYVPLGKAYTIWQNRVAPIAGIATGPVDNDVCPGDLPIMRAPSATPPPIVLESPVT